MTLGRPIHLHPTLPNEKGNKANSSSSSRILFLEKIQIKTVDKRTFTRKRTQRQNDLRYYMQKRNTVIYT